MGRLAPSPVWKAAVSVQTASADREDHALHMQSMKRYRSCPKSSFRCKTKRTAKNDRAQHFSFWLREWQNQSAPAHNVSDLACRNRAGITVTFSRGFSPHSAARLPKDRRAVRYFHLSNGSIAYEKPNCKGIPAHPPRFSCAYPVRNGHPMHMVVSSVGCSSTSGFCASA